MAAQKTLLIVVTTLIIVLNACNQDLAKPPNPCIFPPQTDANEYVKKTFDNWDNYWHFCRISTNDA